MGWPVVGFDDGLYPYAPSPDRQSDFQSLAAMDIKSLIKFHNMF